MIIKTYHIITIDITQIIDNTLNPNLYFSLIIVKSLQLRGRRQIAKLRKYCLVHEIVFL